MRYLKLLAASTFAAALITSGIARASPHAEVCLQKTWGYLKGAGYEYAALNTCAYAVAVWFKSRKGPIVQGMVHPGEYFRTGLTIDKFETERKASGWIAAVCQADEVPDRVIADATWDAILDGKYACKKP